MSKRTAKYVLNDNFETFPAGYFDTETALQQLTKDLEERLDAKKIPRPPSGSKRNGTSEGVRKAHNRGIDQAIATIKEYLEATDE